jgi:pimeloyl-ACP methyl ester carboxylesterase
MMRRLLPALSAFVLLAGCTANEAAEEPTAKAGTPKNSSAPPGLVDIGERSLFLDCRGSGSPTVVLEAGLTGDLRTWENVMPVVQKETRVCAYDRANIGRSEPAPTPRTAADVVADLHALLAAAGEKPPYLLTGFSFGGLTTQLFAQKYPEDVAGLVLVESNHPDEVEQFEAHLTPDQIAQDRQAVSENSEGIDVFESMRQVGAKQGLPSVPLVVVTAGKSEGWPPGWDPQLFDRLRAQQQADLASLVPGGRQIIAKDSGHDVPAQQPQAIVDAIKTVLDAVG